MPKFKVGDVFEFTYTRKSGSTYSVRLDSVIERSNILCLNCDKRDCSLLEVTVMAVLATGNADQASKTGGVLRVYACEVPYIKVVDKLPTSSVLKIKNPNAAWSF